jgi:hypothetical protein
MKLEKVLIPRNDEPLTYLETERYVFTEFELKTLLIDTFQAGAVRALNIENDSLSISNYINNLFKD